MSKSYYRACPPGLFLVGLLVSALLPAACSAQAEIPKSTTTEVVPTEKPGTLADGLKPAEEPGVRAPGKTMEGEDKRIFGVLPNYRTAEMSAATAPIDARIKLHIAMKDTFDYPLFGTSAVLAGLNQWADSHPQFGQGTKGYLKRLGTSYTDQLMGNFLTEGVLPIAFHEDPRYFRKSTGFFSARTFYALSRVLLTQTDAGHTTLNYAELVGNGIAAAAGLAYYTDSRSAPEFLQNWGTQLLTDGVSQILKEFWPDIKRRRAEYRERKAAQRLAAQP